MKGNSRYIWLALWSLPTHCERVAQYWSTLACMDQYASGKAMGQRYKSAKAFKQGLRERGLPEPDISRAFADTLEMARMKYKASKNS